MNAVMEESVAAEESRPESRPMEVRHVTHGVEAGPLRGTKPSCRQAYLRGIYDGIRDAIFRRRHGGFWIGPTR